MFSEVTLKRDSLELNVAVGPDSGPPLILLHGVTRTWQTFVPLLPSLITRWRVIGLDFRGHGRSKPCCKGYLVRDYVDDVALAMDELVEGPAFLYGHSLGAMVATCMASRFPSRIAGLVMEDPPWQAMGQRINASVLGSLFRGLHEVAQTRCSADQRMQKLCEIVLQNPEDGSETRLGDARDQASLRYTALGLSKMDPNVLKPVVGGAWLDGVDLDTLFGQVQAPALLLQADPNDGGMLTDMDAARVESQIPDCSRIRFPETHHLIHSSRTEQLLNYVIPFLESLRT